MIHLTDVELRRGATVLISESDLVVHAGQHIGIIGANGSGKSSLFKLLLGQLTQDSGNLSVPAEWRISHMAQEVNGADRSALDFVLDGDSELREVEDLVAEALDSGDDTRLAKAYEHMDLIHGFDARYRAEQLLHGLGFHQSETTSPVNSFSGGWRIRLNLAQALMSPSDLLMLDEPTNHLDLDATLWLEQWLKSFPGTLLMISHDRDFIDNIAQGIVHIERQRIFSYKGNYSSFERARSERLALQQASFEKQQRRRKDVEDFVARFRYKASKAKQAQSRIKELERMEEIAPAHIDSPFDFTFRSPAKKAQGALVKISQADMGYGRTKILSGVDFDLYPGSRIGLLGPNGAGKSTLIGSLKGDLDLLSGQRIYGENTRIGYFAQHQLEVLDLKASPLLHIQRLSPKSTEQEIRNFLGGFDFHNHKALDVIKDFSGGEKARLALALIVWQKPNLLLLDEPTNHLDLEMRHALTMALQSYEGAVVVISHDRHLLRNTIDELYLVADGVVEPFDGDLKDYQKWLKNYSRSPVQLNSVSTNPPTEQIKAPVDKKMARQKSAEERKKVADFNKTVKSLELKIAGAQKLLLKIEEQLANADIYSENRRKDLKQCLAKQIEIKQTIGALENEWLETQVTIQTIA